MAKEPLPVRAGVSLGIVWGIACVLMAVGANYGYAAGWVSLLAEVYVGYGSSLAGIIAGAAYGFVDGFIAAFLVVWLYNKLKINK